MANLKNHWDQLLNYFRNLTDSGPDNETGTDSLTHVFNGSPDARQSSELIPVSRFRPRYRALTNDEKKLHDDIKAQAEVLERMFEKVRPGAYRDHAMLNLEQSVMFIIKDLTA